MKRFESIGAKIKALRKKRKISQEALAEMISMNHRSILRIENQQALPTLETLDKIATALNIDIIDFFEMSNFENKQDIIDGINQIMDKMSFSDLEKFYKSIYYFYN